MVREKHSRTKGQQEQGTEEKQGASREQHVLPCGCSAGHCIGCGACWWQMKEVPELPEKRVWILSKARGRLD